MWEIKVSYYEKSQYLYFSFFLVTCEFKHNFHVFKGIFIFFSKEIFLFMYFVHYLIFWSYTFHFHSFYILKIFIFICDIHFKTYFQICLLNLNMMGLFMFFAMASFWCSLLFFSFIAFRFLVLIKSISPHLSYKGIFPSLLLVYKWYPFLHYISYPFGVYFRVWCKAWI